MLESFSVLTLFAGAPDMFVVYSGIAQDDAALVLGYVFGLTSLKNIIIILYT